VALLRFCYTLTRATEYTIWFIVLIYILALLPLISSVLIPFGLILLPSNSKDKEHIRKWLMDTVTDFSQKSSKEEIFIKVILTTMRNTNEWTYQNLSKELIRNLLKEMDKQPLKTISENN